MHKNSFYYIFMVSIVIIVLFSALNYLHLTPGTFMDWLVGLLAFWWLKGITTIPWNMYLSAKEVLDEASVSESKGIQVNQKNVVYAGGLYLIAWLNITHVGYFAAAAALILTGVRPLGRLYEYISEKLRSIRNEIQYPRDDVYELKTALSDYKMRLEKTEALLNFEKSDSWVSIQNQKMEHLKTRFTELHVELDSYQIEK